jgi:hypothetical protein
MFNVDAEVAYIGIASKRQKPYGHDTVLQMVPKRSSLRLHTNHIAYLRVKDQSNETLTFKYIYILPSPFPRACFVTSAIGLVQMGNVGNERVVRVRIC